MGCSSRPSFVGSRSAPGFAGPPGRSQRSPCTRVTVPAPWDGPAVRRWQAGAGGGWGSPLLSAGTAAPAPLLRAEGLVLGAQPGFCSAAQVELPPEPDGDAGGAGDGDGQGWRGGSPQQGVQPPTVGAAPAPPLSGAAGCADLCSATCILLRPGSCTAPEAPLQGRGCPCPLQAAALPPSPAGWWVRALARPGSCLPADGSRWQHASSQARSSTGHGAGPGAPTCLHRPAQGEPGAAAGRGRQEHGSRSSLPPGDSSADVAAWSCWRSPAWGSGAWGQAWGCYLGTGGTRLPKILVEGHFHAEAGEMPSRSSQLGGPCQILWAATACRGALPAASACAAGDSDQWRGPPQTLSRVDGAGCPLPAGAGLRARAAAIPIPSWLCPCLA